LRTPHPRELRSGLRAPAVVEGVLVDVELDAFGFYAISLAEETRSAGEISEAMGAGRPPSAAFMQLLGQLRDAGLLEFEEP